MNKNYVVTITWFILWALALYSILANNIESAAIITIVLGIYTLICFMLAMLPTWKKGKYYDLSWFKRESKIGYYLSWVFWLCIAGFIFFGFTGWLLNLFIFHTSSEIFILLALGTWGVLIVLDLINKRRIKRNGE